MKSDDSRWFKIDFTFSLCVVLVDKRRCCWIPPPPAVSWPGSTRTVVQLLLQILVGLVGWLFRAELLTFQKFTVSKFYLYYDRMTHRLIFVPVQRSLFLKLAGIWWKLQHQWVIQKSCRLPQYHTEYWALCLEPLRAFCYNWSFHMFGRKEKQGLCGDVLTVNSQMSSS